METEQHRECVAHRQRVGGGAQSVLRTRNHKAGQEGAERHRHAKKRCRADRDAQRDHQHGQREQLPRPRRGHAIQERRNRPAADNRREDHETRNLQQRDRDVAHDLDGRQGPGK